MSLRRTALLEEALADALEERDRARDLAAYLEAALDEALGELAAVSETLAVMRRRMTMRVVE